MALSSKVQINPSTVKGNDEVLKKETILDEEAKAKGRSDS